MSTAEIISGISSELCDSICKPWVSWLRHPDNIHATIKMESGARTVMGIKKQLCGWTVTLLVHP